MSMNETTTPKTPYDAEIAELAGTTYAPEQQADLRLKREGWLTRDAELASDEIPVCGLCGGPMTRNPHPDAGKPSTLLEVGTMWVCIPCLYRTRHIATQRADAVDALARSASHLASMIPPMDELRILYRWLTASSPPEQWREYADALDGLEAARNDMLALTAAYHAAGGAS